MGKPLAVKLLTVISVGVVLLGHLPPVAAGVLLCIGDETDSDCCRKPGSKRLLDGSECTCCITVAGDEVRGTTRKPQVTTISRDRVCIAEVVAFQSRRINTDPGGHSRKDVVDEHVIDPVAISVHQVGSTTHECDGLAVS